MVRINLRQVEAFRAMMLTGSVTEAATLMAITQPAVSRLLRDLQALLKMKLFERRGTGLVPTAAASALYTEVERSFVGLERITAAAEEIRYRRIGALKVAALPALVNGYLPRLIGRFLTERPNLTLSCFGVISPIVVDWVLNNQCDVGFAEVAMVHAGLPSAPLPALPRVAIVPEGHRLAAKSLLKPRDFEGESFVSLTTGSTGRHIIDQVFNRDDVWNGVVRARGWNLRSVHGAGIRGTGHCRAPLRASHRFRGGGGIPAAAQSVGDGFGLGRDSAPGVA
jgi:DNA-binding transcriptional LysR family regulator